MSLNALINGGRRCFDAEHPIHAVHFSSREFVAMKLRLIERGVQ